MKKPTAANLCATSAKGVAPVPRPIRVRSIPDQFFHWEAPWLPF